MSDVAERIRDVVFQPLADILVVHAGVNCFRAAAIALVSFVALDGAAAFHMGMLSGADPMLPFRFALLAGMSGVALHLDRFQRRSGGTAFRVVHPFLRRTTTQAVLYLGFSVAALAYGTSVAATDRMGWTEGAWYAAEWGDDVLSAFGLVLASCEWRRLPRARRREKTATTGLAMRGA